MKEYVLQGDDGYVKMLKKELIFIVNDLESAKKWTENEIIERWGLQNYLSGNVYEKIGEDMYAMVPLKKEKEEK